MKKLKTRKELNIEKTYLEEQRHDYAGIFERVRLNPKTMLSFCVMLLVSYLLAFGQEVFEDGMNFFSTLNAIVFGMVLILNVVCMFALKHAVTNTSKKIFSVSLMLSVGLFLIWFNLADVRYVYYKMSYLIPYLDMFTYDFFYGVTHFFPLIISVATKIITFAWFIYMLTRVKKEIAGYVYNKKIPIGLIICLIVFFAPIMTMSSRRTMANSMPLGVQNVYTSIAVLIMTMVLMKFAINTIIYFQITMFGKKEDEKVE